MKMIKAMKKLKFWSRKKRRKSKSNYEPFAYYHPPPPPPRSPPPPPLPPSAQSYHHCCPLVCSPKPQPSAPPLPPWLDYNGQQIHDLAYASESLNKSSQEIVVETSSINQVLPGDSSVTCSYQQYTVPNPVYGLPVVKETRRDKFCGFFFGGVFEFGGNLIRCFCPCFRV